MAASEPCHARGSISSVSGTFEVRMFPSFFFMNGRVEVETENPRSDKKPGWSTKKKCLAVAGACVTIVAIALIIWAAVRERDILAENLVSNTDCKIPNTSTTEKPSTFYTQEELLAEESLAEESYDAVLPYMYITAAGTVSWMEKDRVILFKRGNITEMPVYYQIFKARTDMSDVGGECEFSRYFVPHPKGEEKLLNRQFDASFLFSNNSNVLDDIAAALAPFESQLFDDGSDGLFSSRLTVTTTYSAPDRLFIRDRFPYRAQYLDLATWRPMLCEGSKNYAAVFREKWSTFSYRGPNMNVAFRYVKAPSKSHVCIELIDCDKRTNDPACSLHPSCQLVFE